MSERETPRVDALNGAFLDQHNAHCAGMRSTDVDEQEAYTAMYKLAADLERENARLKEELERAEIARDGYKASYDYARDTLRNALGEDLPSCGIEYMARELCDRAAQAEARVAELEAKLAEAEKEQRKAIDELALIGVKLQRAEQSLAELNKDHNDSVAYALDRIRELEAKLAGMDLLYGELCGEEKEQRNLAERAEQALARILRDPACNPPASVLEDEISRLKEKLADARYQCVGSCFK
jgi:chromosome segregation ATPase